MDRQVGRVTSAAVAKLVRRENLRLVAITCHYDVEEWLQPDWVIQPHLSSFAWRHLQRRPPITLDIFPVDRATWRMFRHHHYLSANLPNGPGGQAYGGFVDGECIAFAWVCGLAHPAKSVAKIRRARRLVVLPDWQGLGIGTRMEEAIAERYHEQGYRFRSLAVHPGLVRHYIRSPRWALTALPPKQARSGRSAHKGLMSHQNSSRMMLIYSFEFRG